MTADRPHSNPTTIARVCSLVFSEKDLFIVIRLCRLGRGYIVIRLRESVISLLLLILIVPVIILVQIVFQILIIINLHIDFNQIYRIRHFE